LEVTVGQSPIPTSNVAAVAATVTILQPNASGFARVNSSGSSAAATLNFAANETVNQFVIAPVINGRIVLTIPPAGRNAHAVIDVAGYYSTENGSTGSVYTPTSPSTRLVDTRNGTGICPTAACAPLAAATSRMVQASGRAGLPSSGVTAVILNTTVFDPAGTGFLQVGRSDAGTSASGTINYTTGNEVNDVVIVPVNSNGQFRIWASTATDVILDVAGYYTAPTNGTASSATLETVTPARTVDTRTSTGTCSPSCAQLAAQSQVKIGVRGIGGIPNDATSVVAFVSVIAPSAIGFFRVNPIGIGVGTNGVATINYDNGVAGMTVIAPIASDGTITVAATTAADVVVDVTGYMTTPTWTYRYSSDGLRSAKTGPTGVRTEFTWTAHGGLALLLGQHRGTATTWVIQGPGGQPVQQINPDSTVTWLHHDQLGSVRLGTNSSGNNVSARSWDAYGNPATASAGTATPILGYAGEYTDTETGYIYLRARYYDPASGQFLTRDPLFAMTGEPYGYTGGNPTNATDPTGLFCIAGRKLNGSCRGSDLLGDAVDVVEEVAENPVAQTLFVAGT
jgi:RHS repeat-associated protein